MGSQLQTSGGMKLATGLLLAGTIVVAFSIVGAKAKPQTVSASVHVSVGGRTDTTGRCVGENRKCLILERECCRGLMCVWADWVGYICMDPHKCSLDGEECDGEVV